MSYLTATLGVLSVLYVLPYQFVHNGDARFISSVAMAIIDLGMLSVLFFILLHYLYQVNKKYSDNNVFLRAGIIGGLPLLWITGYDFQIIFGNGVLLGLLITSIGLSALIGPVLVEGFVQRFPLQAHDRRLLIPRVSPRESIDLWRFHGIMLFILLLPIILKKMFW